MCAAPAVSRTPAFAYSACWWPILLNLRFQARRALVGRQVAAHGKQGERALREALRRANESGAIVSPIRIWVDDTGKLNVGLQLPQAENRNLKR